MSVQLSREDFTDLVELLSALPEFQTEADRVTFVQGRLAGLAPPDRRALNFDLSGTPRTAAERLVSKLAEYGRLSNSQELLGRFLEGWSHELNVDAEEKVNGLIADYYMEREHADNRDAFARLLDEISPIMVRQWYQYTLRDIAAADAPTPDRLTRWTSDDVVENLLQRPVSRNGVWPLQFFTDGIAGILESSPAGSLRELARWFAERHGISAAVLADTQTRVAIASDGEQSQPVVIVHLQPRGGSQPAGNPGGTPVPDKYDIHICLFDTNSGGTPYDTYEIAREDLLGEMSRGLSEVIRSYPEGMPRPCIEFIVPRRLLGLEVEWLEIDPDDLGEPEFLGLLYPVALRVHERTNNANLIAAVLERWQKIESVERAGGRSRIFPIEKREVLEDFLTALFEQEKEEEAAGEPATSRKVVACVGLTLSDDELTPPCWVGPLRAGVPIALWARRAAAVPGVRALLQQLANTSPTTLRKIVQEARVQAAPEVRRAKLSGQKPDDALLGAHLALIWEDKTRYKANSATRRSPVR